MNRLPSVLVAVLLLSFPLRAAESIAVNRLTSSGMGSGEAYSLQNALQTELGKTGTFDVMERGQMEEILKEQGFQQTGACDASCAVEIGQLLAVKYMVLGHLGMVGETYTVNLRLVDVGTGKIERDVTENHRGSIDDLLTKVVPRAVQKLAGVYLPPSSRRNLWIAAITGGVAVVAVPVVYFATRNDQATKPKTDVRLIWDE